MKIDNTITVTFNKKTKLYRARMKGLKCIKVDSKKPVDAFVKLVRRIKRLKPIPLTENTTACASDIFEKMEVLFSNPEQNKSESLKAIQKSVDRMQKDRKKRYFKYLTILNKEHEKEDKKC